MTKKKQNNKKKKKKKNDIINISARLALASTVVNVSNDFILNWFDGLHIKPFWITELQSRLTWASPWYHTKLSSAINTVKTKFPFVGALCVIVAFSALFPSKHINVQTKLIVNVHQRCSNVDIRLKRKVESTHVHWCSENSIETIFTRKWLNNKTKLSFQV